MLCDYKEKGHQVEYLGMDDVEGTECYKLKVTSKNGKVSYYLIDPASNYIVRVLSKQKAAGKEVDAQVTFVKDSTGQVNQLILHQNGANIPGRRVGK